MNEMLTPQNDDATSFTSADGHRVFWRGRETPVPNDYADQPKWCAASADGSRRVPGLTYEQAAAKVEEWSGPDPSTLEKTVTDAPADYDWVGFGCRQLAVLGTSTRGRTVRLVGTPATLTENQRGRYGSGQHMAMEPSEFEKIKDLVMAPSSAE